MFKLSNDAQNILVDLNSKKHSPEEKHKLFINTNCGFQDCGGIIIEDDVLIGMNVAIATLNHNIKPELRSITIPSKLL